MPIGPFIEGEFFNPELVEIMSQALVDACQELGLRPKPDPAVRVLALRIIKQARAGVRDRALLQAAALEGLGTKAAE